MNSSDIINRLRKHPSVGMSFLDDAAGYVDSFASKIGKYVPDVRAYLAAISDLTSTSNTLQVGLQNLSILQEKQNANYLEGIKGATFLLEREKQLAKAFGMTAKASALLSREYSTMSSELGISDELMTKYRLSVNKILPGMSSNLKKTGEYGKSLFRTNDLLQQHIGLTDDQTNSLTLAAAATGTDLETSVNRTAELAEQMKKITGETDTFQTMIEGVANTSLTLRMEYSKFPGSLEVATLKARRLGMSMADIDASATSLLDIETSVGKELEYQLISGKRLVDNQGKSLTNKLREAKFSGNPLKQAEAMAEILESQQETLEGNNFLAKKALADALGLTTEQLAGAQAQKKLQEQIYQKMKDANDFKTADGTVIKSSLELTTDDLAAGLEKFGKSMSDIEKANATTELKTTQSLITPAEKTADYLKKIVDDGIRLQTGTGFEKILTDSLVNLPSALKNFTQGTKYLQQPAADFGKNQLISQMGQGMVDEFTAYARSKIGSVTIFGIDLIQKAHTKLNTTIEKLYGSAVKGEIPSKSAKDAVTMHDGIIKFDDRDKFTMIASPYGAMHENVADKITGGGNYKNGLDANAIAKAIQSAIQAGLSNVAWSVNLDPMAVDKAIKFNSGRLNS